ncbi:MAG: twin-arginine translocase TatA/TatE family subunit [Verrucomicrobia bacterium]|nr:twin-arginine translocase TatA/TatE family subunit [Verrucomicrobiota bacterium]
MFGLGPMELIAVLAVIVFFFGAKKLPGLAKGIGNSIKEFKRGMSGEQPTEKKQAVLEKN